MVIKIDLDVFERYRERRRLDLEVDKKPLIQWETETSRSDYVNWISNQPDNYLENENCVHMKHEAKGQWNDCECDKEFYAVCEKNL